MSDRLSIIDTIEKDGKFSAFAGMLRSSKAADLITGAGPFTVFAPTNDAFGKVPDAQMNGWLSQTDQTDLAKVLSYHIVPSKLFASNLEAKEPAATLSGAKVTFSDIKGLKVNASGIQARNIEATNGIIHALDTVLALPADAEATSVTPASAGTTIVQDAAAETTPPTAQADGHSDPPPVSVQEPNALPATPALAAAPPPGRPTFVL